MQSLRFVLNGKERTITTEPDRSLLEVLREDFDLTGTKYGCGEGSCRSCTVLVDGRPLASCQVPVSKAAEKSLVTIEGIMEEDKLHPLQEAFIAENAMQCGYCVPGMIMTAIALLDAKPNPTREEIATFMNGNLCRCCNYVNILNAIERAAAEEEVAS